MSLPNLEENRRTYHIPVSTHNQCLELVSLIALSNAVNVLRQRYRLEELTEQFSTFNLWGESMKLDVKWYSGCNITNT